MVDHDVDITITGSNAYLLSGELATLLSGRYIEIQMLPLSFKEYLTAFEQEKKLVDDYFEAYLKYGGLPAMTQIEHSPMIAGTFLSGIYNTVIMKDIIARNEIKEIATLENVIKYMADNIGSVLSASNISKYLSSNVQKTTYNTVDNYLKWIENAFIFYRVPRYDIKGKKLLKTMGKYYIVDTGIRNSLLGFRDGDYGHILENVVYLELKRRGYQVSIGRVGEMEVDFIAKNMEELIYYQVTQTIAAPETKERELRVLRAIPDNFKKVILSMDRMYIQSEEGILFENIIDFLLK